MKIRGIGWLLAGLRNSDWRGVTVCVGVSLIVAGCAGAANSGYPQLPGATASVAQPVLTPAEQQKVIDDLNAAKTKNQQTAQ
jgi:hypothetical protein